MQNIIDAGAYLRAQRELYLEKNAWMDANYERVEPHAFYREIFPVGTFERRGHYEDKKGNGVGISICASSGGSEDAAGGSVGLWNGIGMNINGDGLVHRFVVNDEHETLDELIGQEFAIMSPVSYFGKSRTGKNARYLYAITFDLDGVDMPQLRDTFHQMNSGFIPSATFVVNSGTGLHLYYVLDRPVPMYKQNQQFLKELKYSLSRRIWNKFTSNIPDPQIQGVLQGFRVVGSGTKLGLDYPVVAYRYGKAVSIEYLLQYVPDTNGDLQRVTGALLKDTIPLAEARKKYPDWYERRIVNGERRGCWTVKRDLYDWWLRKIETEIHVGHRFYGIMTLAIYAIKCNIDEEELRRDAYRLMKIYDDMSYEDSNRFTEDDVVKALEMYNESFVTFPRADIAKYSGIQIPANKRNGKNQKQHLEVARAVRDVKVKHRGKAIWWEGNGRPDKEQLVRDYMNAHPGVRKKTEIADALQIDRHTVGKYYDKIRLELETVQHNKMLRRIVVDENGKLQVRMVAISEILAGVTPNDRSDVDDKRENLDEPNSVTRAVFKEGDQALSGSNELRLSSVKGLFAELDS